MLFVFEYSYLHLNNSGGFMKKGFTLAEVLITLGIIGVVAAMTMPSLIQNYRKKEATTRIKKFYSMMSQAVLLSTNDNGEPTEWTRKAEDGSSDKQSINAQNAYDFFMTYLAPYIKYVSIDKAIKSDNPADARNYEVRIIFSDSSVVYLHNGGCLDMNYDYNGTKAPNITGKDKFIFLLCTNEEQMTFWQGSTKKPFTSYGPGKINSREEALSYCKNNAAYCSTLLQYDNWEFLKDYPYKL